MPTSPGVNRKPSLFSLLLVVLVGFAVIVCLRLVSYRPDRPVATIAPASSTEPTFVVQIIRPRLGLPLGGLLPPQLFGVDAQLRIDSTSEDAEIQSVGLNRIELGADGWELLLVRDDDGQLTSETQVVFNLVFEERVQRVRCRPIESVVGTLETVVLEGSSELAGSFDIELARCEDAETGTPLGWPSQPLILHGSFDRLPLDSDSRK